MIKITTYQNEVCTYEGKALEAFELNGYLMVTNSFDDIIARFLPGTWKSYRTN